MKVDPDTAAAPRGWWPDLSHRVCEPELMDDPALDPAVHQEALRGLARLNRLSFSSRPSWHQIVRLAKQCPKRELSVLDIATGGGDVLVSLALRARRAGVRLRLAGCDVSEAALQHARKRAAQAGVEVDFFALNAVRDPVPSGFDVIQCCLFLHHLATDDALMLLSRMYSAAERLALVNDLVRSPASWLQVKVATRVVCRSQVVHVDGPRSVEAAFTARELHNLALQSGWKQPQVRPCWPCRMLLSGDKGNAENV